MHPFSLLSLMLFVFSFVIKKAPQTMHRLAWERSALYRDMPGILEYFEEWDPSEEPAPRLKPKYQFKQKKISTFLFTSGLIFVGLAISMGALRTAEEITLYLTMLIMLFIFFLYLYWRVTEKSKNTGRRILRPSPPGISVDPIDGMPSISGKTVWFFFKQFWLSIFHIFIGILLFMLVFAVVAIVVNAALSWLP